MEQYRDFAIPAPGTNNIVTLGAFDGLHRGHQAIIRRTVRAARDLATKAVVITFEVPPRMVISPEQTAGTLVTNEQKAELLAAMGVDVMILAKLTPALRDLEPEEFVVQCLMPLNPAFIMAGPHMSFGKDRKGDIALLRELGREHGFKVIRVPALKDGRGRTISSTNIRDCLAQGRFNEAVAMLGRDYSLCGKVVHGLGYAGTRIGISTANIDTGMKVLPPPGVYAVYACTDNKLMPGVLNIGRTVPPKVEVHIFGIAKNLYGKKLTVWFKEKLRNEIEFKDLGHEKEVIAADVRRARHFFGLDQGAKD